MSEGTRPHGRAHFLFRLRVGLVLLIFVLDFAFLVLAARALTNSFNTLELLIADGAVMLLLGAGAYALVRRRGETPEPGPSDSRYWNLAVVATFGITVAGLSQSTWYPDTLALLGISLSVGLFMYSILAGADRATSAQIALIFALAILIKSSIYMSNLVPWVGDGRDHLDGLVYTLGVGHTTTNLADYFYYPGFYFLNTMVLGTGGVPYVLSPLPLFAEICTSSLIAFLIGRRVAGERAGLAAGVVVAATLLTNISWQPSQVGLIYPMMLLYLIISHESIVGSRKLAALAWALFGAALITYPVAGLMAVVVGLGEFLWRFRFGRIYTFAIGTAVSLTAYVLFVSTFLFGDVILSVFGVSTGPVQLPIASVPAASFGVLYVVQYTLNFLVFLVPLFFCSVILILFLVTPQMRERFVLIVAVIAVPSLAIGQLLLPGRVTNWTEVLYLYPFTAMAGAMGSLFLIKRLPSRRVSAALVAILIAFVAVTAIVGYSPSQALYKTQTPFYPFYLSPATYDSAWVGKVMPNGTHVVSDADTISWLFPLASDHARDISVFYDLTNSTLVTCGNSTSAVVLNALELSRIYAPVNKALYNSIVSTLDSEPAAVRSADSMSVAAYVCPGG